jgi:hypothetical protein
MPVWVYDPSVDALTILFAARTDEVRPGMLVDSERAAVAAVGVPAS